MKKSLSADIITSKVSRNHIMMTLSDGWPWWTDPMLLFLRDWMKKVQTVSKGKVHIAYLDVSCEGRVPDPTGVSVGFKNWKEMCQYVDIIDSTTGMPYLHKDLPINTNYKWFVYGTDVRGSLKAYTQLLQEIPAVEAEFTKLNLKWLRGYAGVGVSIQTRDKPVKTLDDLNGLKVTGEGLDYEGLFIDLGVIGVPIKPDKLSAEESYSPEYAAIRRGEADGTLALTEFLSDKNMNGADVIRYVTFLHFPTPPHDFSLINLNLWNNLPYDIQQVFEECNRWANEEVCKVEERATQYAIDYAKSKGCKFFELPETELDKFNKLVEKKAIKKATELDALGIPGTQIFQRTRQIIEEHERKKIKH